MIVSGVIAVATPITARGRSGIRIFVDTRDGERFSMDAVGPARCEGVYRAAGIPRAMPPSALEGKRISASLARWPGYGATMLEVLPYFADATPAVRRAICPLRAETRAGQGI